MLVLQYNNICCLFVVCLVVVGLYAVCNCGFYQDSCKTNREDPEFKVSVPLPELFSTNTLFTATMLVALDAGQEEHPTALHGACVPTYP